jgi:hypothetical protein
VPANLPRSTLHGVNESNSGAPSSKEWLKESRLLGHHCHDKAGS